MSRSTFMVVPVVCLLVLALVPAQTRAFDPPLVVLQAGHWKSNEHPEEFAWLRTSTGASHGGVREVDLNIDIAHRAAEYLRAWGNEAYVLPATVPPNYRADAFVSIHGDGHNNREARGYKIATYWRDWVASDMLVRELIDEYGRQTGLPLDWRVTANMRGYYAFNSGLYEHTIAEDTPGAIVEMGFLSNAADRGYLVANRDTVARAIALGIARFLGARPAGGWPPPPPMPRGDIVEILHNRTPLHEGPGSQFRLVDRTSQRQRFAVSERRDGWAKLFSYTGNEWWVQEHLTRPVYIPQLP